MTTDVENTGGEVSAEELQEATEMGWQDKDVFKGRPEDWVDAKTFLDRGRTLLPVVNANNRKLREEIRQRDRQLAELQTGLQAANAAIEALQSDHEEDVKAQVEAAKAKLKEELTIAFRDGDHEGAAALTAKIAELGTAAEDAEERDDAKRRRPNGDGRRPRVDPEIVDWLRDNPDYTQGRKGALANAIADELHAERTPLRGKAFLEEVRLRVDEALDAKRGTGTSRVASDGGGQQRRNGDGGGGKTYADLPAEAKAICDRQASRLVGEGRRHKTIDSWRASYAKQYFAS